MDPGEKEDVRRSHQCTVSALERMRAGNYRAAVRNKANRSSILISTPLLRFELGSVRSRETLAAIAAHYEINRSNIHNKIKELQHVLERIIHAAPNSTSPDEFLLNCLDEHASLNVMIFFRLVTSIEIHMNSNYYRPKMHAEYRSMEEFVLEQAMIVDFETDQLRVKALSEALGIPTKVVQFDVLAPVPELPKLPYCFFDGSSRRNFNLGLLSDDFLLISGSSDEHAVPATGPPSPAILDLRAPSYVTLVFWRGHYGVLYRNSVLSGLKHDFF
uniref:Uncharacterized protein n=1 Tax=Ananas comosus var. bracteatus TaxID=296719 RepID=A0A6V7Q0Y2_ANACO|nr:unnamed protein product [Ananas comosus var. bracteatus]